MALISEDELINILKDTKKALLLEPDYQTSYYPLGLGKIASFLKKNNSEYVYSRDLIRGNFDKIFITTLFTNDYKCVKKYLDRIKQSLYFSNFEVIIGGVLASLQPEKFEKYKVFKGCSEILDNYLPDYSFDLKLKKEKWKDAAVVFTTRGCPNKCGYCVVWRMENPHILNNFREQILNNDKSILLIQDNNILSFGYEHFSEMVNIIAKTNKKVIFNNGLDHKFIKTDEQAKEILKINYMRGGYQGLRLAFDRMSDDGHYQLAMELLNKNFSKSLKAISQTYVLFNFNDTPQEAYYRMNEAWRYNSIPYMMQYRDIFSDNKKYIGKYWTENLTRLFRLFGFMYGFNNKRIDCSFEKFAKTQNKINLTKEDWDKWYYKK